MEVLLHERWGSAGRHEQAAKLLAENLALLARDPQCQCPALIAWQHQ